MRIAYSAEENLEEKYFVSFYRRPKDFNSNPLSDQNTYALINFLDLKIKTNSSANEPGTFSESDFRVFSWLTLRPHHMIRFFRVFSQHLK